MKVTLALGGGGSKGIAHIGVLRCLEKEGIQVAAVAGTSAGGIIAALYAAGYSPDKILARFKELDFSHIYRHEPGDPPALLGAGGVRRVVTELLGNMKFSELLIPTVLVSVDLRSGKEVLLREGSVVEAVMATIALPGIFPAVVKDEFYLVDGGLLDPVPVAPARMLAPHLPVVAVVLNSPNVGPREIFGPPRIIQNIPLLSQFSKMKVGQAFNIIIHSIEISSSYTTELRLQVDKPDVILRPQVAEIGLFDRVEVEQVALLGERAATSSLPAIKKEFRWDRQLRRYMAPRHGKPTASE